MAPHTDFAVHLPETMMEEHIGGAGCRGCGIGADDAVEREGGLHRLVFEPACEIIGCAFGEEARQVALRFERQLENLAGETRAFPECVKPPTSVGRRFEEQPLQYACGTVERFVISGQARGILFGELRNSGLAAGEAIGHHEGAALVDGPEVGDGAFHDLEPVPMEIEVADDLRVEQAHRIRGNGIAETGMKLFGVCGAAHVRVLFQNHHVEAGRGQIRSGG